MTRRKPLSKEIIADIREQVLNGKSKSRVAREFGITFRTVWNHTKDIRTQKVIPQKLKERIRDEIKNGKSKYQTAKEYNLPTTTVYNIAKDLPSAPSGWPGIRGKTLDLLQEIISKGYVVPSCKYTQQRYMVLRKYFPTLGKVKMNGKTIFYFEGREHDAVRAFLGVIGRNIMSYQDLSNIFKVFHADLSKKEKQAFLFKNQRKKKAKNQGAKKDSSLREIDDSFSFFYIRTYCPPFYCLDLHQKIK